MSFGSFTRTMNNAIQDSSEGLSQGYSGLSELYPSSQGFIFKLSGRIRKCKLERPTQKIRNATVSTQMKKSLAVEVEEV